MDFTRNICIIIDFSVKINILYNKSFFLKILISTSTHMLLLPVNNRSSNFDVFFHSLFSFHIDLIKHQCLILLWEKCFLTTKYQLWHLYFYTLSNLILFSYKCCIFFWDWSLDHYVVSFFVSYHSLYFKVYLSDMSIATPAFFWSPFAWNIFFTAPHFQSGYVPRFEMSLL